MSKLLQLLVKKAIWNIGTFMERCTINVLYMCRRLRYTETPKDIWEMHYPFCSRYHDKWSRNYSPKYLVEKTKLKLIHRN